MNAVTGIGPRTGTSWVMGKLQEAGLKVNGHKFLPDLLVPKHNPQGYWELDPDEPMPTTGISKLWGIWHNTNVNKVVVLERADTKAQLKSMDKVLKDELLLPKCASLWKPEWTSKAVLSMYITAMNEWLTTRDLEKTMIVYTENLNNEIDNIIKFLQEDN
jgi:hypothetical protein